MDFYALRPSSKRHIACALVAAALLCTSNPTYAQSNSPEAPVRSNEIMRLLRTAGSRYMAGPVLPQLHSRDGGSELPIVDGMIHLSTREAILLALENNLDIESAELLRPMAFSDLQRARSGQLLRSLPIAVASGPGSASGNLATAGAAGFEGIMSGQAGVLSGVSVQLAGSQIPNVEPVLFATGSFAHKNDPFANNILTGTNSLVSQESAWGVGVRKGFFTGTDVIAKFDSLRVSQNAPYNSINPAHTASSSLRIQQHLLQGFGLETNMRAIRIAHNNSKVSRRPGETRARRRGGADQRAGTYA